MKEILKQESTSLERSSEPAPKDGTEKICESSPSKMKELQEKLAKLNSRYVVGAGSGVEKNELGKVGLAAIQDIAAKQEAALIQDDITPTNDESVLRYDPVNNKMSLGSLPSSPLRHHHR